MITFLGGAYHEEILFSKDEKYLECDLPSFQSYVSWRDSTSASPDVRLRQLEEAPLCDKTRGEGGSCLCHGSDVLMCDPEANEQMLHYPPLCSGRITTARGNKDLWVP